ncbi:hypothetical protein KP509_11G045700 [Ceratopteris richardii]|nr:hypothetical protein KP509_11G045700 [Ceratopteris richardii]
MQTKQQRLLYKGKERCDRDYLYEFGVKDKSKIVLVEDTKGWEKRLIEMRKDDADAKACKTVSDVQQIVDQVSGQIVSMESDVLKGKKLSDDEIMGKIDFLMCQLVKLDDSKVDGDAKVQKQILVRRVQKYVETLDALKLKNDALKVRNGSTTIALDNISNVRVGPSSVRVNVATSRFAPAKSRSDMPSTPTSTVVTTTWETFGSSTGSASSKSTPPPASEPLLIQWD